jgi:hypothetical protein
LSTNLAANVNFRSRVSQRSKTAEKEHRYCLFSDFHPKFSSSATSLTKLLYRLSVHKLWHFGLSPTYWAVASVESISIHKPQMQYHSENGKASHLSGVENVGVLAEGFL